MKKQTFVMVVFIAATVSSTTLTAQITTAEAQKTRTKSNNANDKNIAAPGSENTAAIKLTTPASGKEFTADEVKKSITFRWTPIIPKPKEAVTYRLKIWQLMQGQNGTQAMRTNQPIVTKDVDNITQATISGIYTGPCKPPYLCDFIWTVEAIGADGKPLTDKATTEASSFGIEKS